MNVDPASGEVTAGEVTSGEVTVQGTVPTRLALSQEEVPFQDGALVPDGAQALDSPPITDSALPDLPNEPSIEASGRAQSMPLIAQTRGQEPRSEWKVVGASVMGAGHKRTGLPCQDAHHWAPLPTENGAGETLIVAVADGAGSAPLSEYGAQAAVQAAVEQAIIEVHRLEAHSANDDETWKAALLSVLAAARESVFHQAEAIGAEVQALATTLILVIARPGLFAAAQVGDGAAVTGDDDGLVWPLTVPQSGEFINETTFLISPKALESAQLTVQRSMRRRLAIFSDGLQMLALKMPEGVPHAPFFVPLFEFLEKASDRNQAHDELAAFLSSPRVQERADDDLSLVLATLL